MRILLLTSEPPSPAHLTGGATRIHRLANTLLERGHEVVVVAPFLSSEIGIVDELRREGFRVLPYERDKPRWIEALNAFARNPRILGAAITEPRTAVFGRVLWQNMRPLALKALSDDHFDVVEVVHELAAPWIADLPDGIPTVLSDLQVESGYQGHRSRRASGIRRALLRFETRRFERFERKWIPRYSSVICMSDSELAMLAQAGVQPLRAAMIANGTDIVGRSAIAPDPASNRVLFTGTLSFPPNEIAAQWLALEVWPKVIAALPEAELTIAGRTPRPRVTALASAEGVRVEADVPQMAPLYADASVCVLPMLEGGGTRLKLADAFASRRAVVSTTNGITGLGVSPGRDVLVADEPDHFARAIVQLLTDNDLRETIAEAGRSFAERTLDWRVLGAQYAEVVEGLATAANQPDG